MLKTTLFLWVVSVCSAAAANPYQRFYWSSGEIDGRATEKVAMLIPIIIEGCDKKLYAQLDTGADLSCFYGPALRMHGIAVDSVPHPDLNFQWYDFDGDYIALGELAYLRWDMGHGVDPDSDDPSDHIVGTIGLDQVIGKILILDFPNSRFAVMKDTMRVESLVTSSINYVNATVSNFKFYVDLVIGNDTLKAVRFDSGSSSVTLILPRDWWQWATGYKGDEPEVIKDSALSWGKYVKFLNAPSRYEMAIGDLKVNSPMVTFVDWPDPTLTTGKFLGNALFYDSLVVVVDCVREKFGVSQGF